MGTRTMDQVMNHLPTMRIRLTTRTMDPKTMDPKTMDPKMNHLPMMRIHLMMRTRRRRKMKKKFVRMPKDSHGRMASKRIARDSLPRKLRKMERRKLVTNLVNSAQRCVVCADFFLDDLLIPRTHAHRH